MLINQKLKLQFLFSIAFLLQFKVFAEPGYEFSVLRSSNCMRGYNLDYEARSKELYQATLTRLASSETVQNPIPKILHFVWLGGKMPTVYNFCIESWRRHHPDWQIWIWNDQSIAQLVKKNQAIFDILDNYSAKVDVALLEILNKYGGIYIDVDFFCVKPFDDVCAKSTLLIGNMFSNEIGYGLFGSAPNHPFVDFAILRLAQRPLCEYKKLDINGVLAKTGPKFITGAFNEYLKKSGDVSDISLFPPSFFYPFPNHLRQDFWEYRKSLPDLVSEFCYPETMAIHLWSTSWFVPVKDGHKNLVSEYDSTRAKSYLYKVIAENRLSELEAILRHGFLPEADVLEYAANVQNHRAVQILNAYSSAKYQIKESSDLKNKKFFVLTCSYNNIQYYHKNLESIFKQNYENWELCYIDDASTDGTAEAVEKFIKDYEVAHKVNFIKNKSRRYALANMYEAIHRVPDDAIVVMVDGDDQLANAGVLKTIADAYNDPNVWLTYGSYAPLYPPFPVYCKDVSDTYKMSKRFFRQCEWCFSHLRTFYAGLFKHIKKNDLMKGDKFFSACYDQAIMLPMLEMCGGKFRFIKDKLYLYNNQNSLCDFRSQLHESSSLVGYIRSLPEYSPIDTI